MNSIDQSVNAFTSLATGQAGQSEQFVDLGVLALIAGAQRLLDKEQKEQDRGYNSDTESSEESGDESSVSDATDELELDSRQAKRAKFAEISASEQQTNNEYIYSVHSEDWTNQVAVANYIGGAVSVQQAEQVKRVAYMNYKLLRDQRAYIGVDCLDEEGQQQRRAGCKRKRFHVHVSSSRR